MHGNDDALISVKLPNYMNRIKCSLMAFLAATILAVGDSSRADFVPQWAKSAVWYQIFPERFRNGDPSNDPTAADIVGADPVQPPREWKIHPWGSDWFEKQPYEMANSDVELKNHLLRRRYGGDLQGIIDQLDYLKGLGINAIYLNPIFDSPSLHKYDGASFHHVDPNFGPDPKGDRLLMANENPLNPKSWAWTKADELALKLIDEAHRRDIRVIFDGVFNHMGINSFAFRNLVKNQQRSPYKDWFTVNSWDDPKTGTRFDYEGWFGVKSLPEIREDENGIVEGPRNYIFHATERWMNPKGKGVRHGIDGWRLDVAYCVNHRFWKDWRKHAKLLNPDAYLTAEIVEPPEKVLPYMQGDEFDGEMNYNFAFACSEFFFNPEKSRIGPAEFDLKLKHLRAVYPPGVAAVSQNLFGSHDSNRIGSHIVNGGIGNFRDWKTYFVASQSDQNSLYSVAKPNADDLQLQKLFVTMQMTYLGAPMVYYGDEVGMWGANDPDCRKPMIWADLVYQDEVYNPNGTKRIPDKVSVNQDLLSYYRKLISIRRESKALSTGIYKTLVADDERALFVFERKLKNERVVVALNNGTKPVSLGVDSMGSDQYKNLIDGTSINSVNNLTSFTVLGKSGVVLRNN
ncbi:MAG: glycoside hydrolase family 13 protein [Armatimonadetes bacterium]|nr:glycoside hydrolase family 13 protein [Akkermansiaceae bacterium]